MRKIMLRATPIGFAVLLGTLSCTAPPDPSGSSEAELTIQLLATAIATADTAVFLDLFWPEATYDDFAGQQTHQGIQEIVAYLTAVHGWGDDVYMNLGRVHATPTGAVGEWVFSAPGLLGIGSINGREIRCLTPEEQAARATDQPGDAGYEPDETDRRDMRLLRERFGITLPYPFDID